MLGNRNGENDGILLKQFTFILEKIIEKRNYNPNISSDFINQATHLAEELLQVIPIETICCYRDKLANNISYTFAKADFLSGIKYLKKNKPELLDEEDAEEDSFFDVAITYNAQKIIAYCLDKENNYLVDNQLTKWIIENDISNIKEYLMFLKEPILCQRFLECAILLDRLEIFELFLNHNINEVLDIAILLGYTIHTNKQKIAYYLLDYLHEKSNFDDIKKELHYIFTEYLSENWFIELIIKKFNKELQSVENKPLIVNMVTCILEKVTYQNEKDFFKMLDQVLTIALDQKIKQEIMHEALTQVITICLKKKKQESDPWEILINENQTTITVKKDENYNENLQSSAHLSTLDKLLFLFHKKYLDLPYNILFPKEKRNDLLVQAINAKNPEVFYYFIQLNKDDLNYRDAEGNTLAHHATKNNFNLAIYILFKFNCSLFKEKNHEQQLPLTLILNQSLVKTLEDERWKDYHDIKAKLLAIEFVSTDIISHKKWGMIEKKYANGLDQLEEFFSSKNNKIPLIVLQACYVEISECLFYILTELWCNQDCNKAEIIKLLNRYQSFFINKKIPFDKMPVPYQIYLKCLIASYSYFGGIEKGLEFIKKSLTDKSNIIDKNYLILMAFSFYTIKILKNKAILPIDGQLSLAQDPDYYLFIIISQLLIVDKEQLSKITLKIITEIMDKVDELSFIDKKYENNRDLQLYPEICGIICYGINLIHLQDNNRGSSNKISQSLFPKLNFLLRILNKSSTEFKEDNHAISLKMKYYISLLKTVDTKINHPQQKVNTANLKKNQKKRKIHNDSKLIDTVQEMKIVIVSKSTRKFLTNLFNRLLISLERIKKQNEGRISNQQVIEIEQRIALHLIKIIPIHELCQIGRVSSSDKNIAANFASADFSAGFNYLLTHNKKENLLYKHTDIHTPFHVAIASNARKVLNFYTTKLSSFKNAIDYNNELEKAVVNNDLKKVNEITNSSYQKTRNDYSLQYAICLDRLEIIEILLSKNSQFQSSWQSTTDPIFKFALHTSSLYGKFRLFEYFLEKVLEKKDFYSLQKNLEELITNKNQLSDNWFITQYINKIIESSFSSDEKQSLMMLILEYILKKGNYNTKESFKAHYDQIINSFPENSDKNTLIANMINKIFFSKDFILYFKITPQKISFFEKIIYTEIPINKIFNEQEIKNSLINAINHNNFFMFSYFFNKEQLSFEDQHGNNIAHISAMKPCQFSILKVGLIDPTLLNIKNKDNKTPIELLEEKKIFIYSDGYRLYRELYVKIFDDNNNYLTMVTDKKWGVLPHRYVHIFTNIDEEITQLANYDIHEDFPYQCYYLLVNFLRLVINEIWDDHPEINKKSICDLIYKFYQVNKKEKNFPRHKNNNNAIKFFILALSRYDNDAKALEVAEYLLEKINNTDLITSNLIKFIMLGLQTGKLLDSEISAYFYSELEITEHDDHAEYADSLDESLLSTVFFKFLASQNSISNVSSVIWNQFKKEIENLNFSPINLGQDTINKEYNVPLSYLYCLFESCGAMANWSAHFFIPSTNDYDAIDVSKIKILFLTKLNEILKFYSTMIDDCSLQSHLDMSEMGELKFKYHHYKDFIDKILIDENSNLKNLQAQVKKKNLIAKPTKQLEQKKAKHNNSTSMIMMSCNYNTEKQTRDVSSVDNESSSPPIILDAIPVIEPKEPFISRNLIEDLLPGTLPKKKKPKKEKVLNKPQVNPNQSLTTSTSSIKYTTISYLDALISTPLKQDPSDDLQTPSSTSNPFTINIEKSAMVIDKPSFLNKEKEVDVNDNTNSNEEINTVRVEIPTTSTPQELPITDTSNSLLPKVSNFFAFFSRKTDNLQAVDSIHSMLLHKKYGKITITLCEILMNFYQHSSVRSHQEFIAELVKIIDYCHCHEDSNIDHYKNTISVLLKVFDNEKNWSTSDYQDLLADEVKINVDLRLFAEQLVGAHYVFNSYNILETAQKYYCYLYYCELLNDFNNYIAYAFHRLNEIPQMMNQLSAKINYLSYHENTVSLIREMFQKEISLEKETTTEEIKPMEYKFRRT